MTGCHVPNTGLRKLKWGAHGLTARAISKLTLIWGRLPASPAQGTGGHWGRPRILMGAKGQAGFFLWA